MLELPNQRPVSVLVYVVNTDVAGRLADLLASHDMAVTRAHSPLELEEVARIGGLDVATTTTSEIERIRKTTSLPVVNIDAFILPQAMSRNGSKSSARFDRVAFLKRLVDVGTPKTRRFPGQR